MKDMVPKGTGNSRFMKSAIPANITHEELVALLRAGTFPYDLGSLNPTGIATQGTPLNKNSLLRDEIAQLLGFQQTADATVTDALATVLLNSGAVASGYVSPIFSKPEVFNNFCGILGIPVKATWAATCADASAKAAMLQNGAIMHIIFDVPALYTVFGSLPFTLENIVFSVKANWYDMWPIGSAVDINLSAFTFDNAFNAGTYTFELVGIDQDIDPTGAALPLTLFMRHLMANTQQHSGVFKMNAANDNTFTSSTAYTSRNNLRNALPADWRNIMAPLVRKHIAANGVAAPVAYDLPCFLYREGEIFASHKHSRKDESILCNRYQIYVENKGTLIKKTANGAGSAGHFWECSPGASRPTAYCFVNANGTANADSTSSAYGLCFGFCIAREQQ